MAVPHILGNETIMGESPYPSYIEEHEDEGLQGLREDILKELSTDFVPVHVKRLRALPWSNLPLFLTTFPFGAAIVLFVGTLAIWDRAIANVWSLVFLPILVVASLLLPALGYEAVVDAAPFILLLPADRAGLQLIRARLQDMYRGQGQWLLSIFLAILAIADLWWLRIDGMLPTPFQSLSVYVFAIGVLTVPLAGFVGGWGLWSICTMSWFVGGFRRLWQIDPRGTRPTRSTGLRLNPIAPAETVGIKRLLRVAVVYSLYYSVGVLAIGLPVLFMPWPGQRGIAFMASVYVMPVAFAMVLVFSLIYPPWSLSSIVTRARDETLLQLEDELRRIVSASGGSPTRDTMPEIERIRSLQKELLGSKTVLIRSNIATSVLSLAVQVPVAVQWMKRAGIMNLMVDRARDWFGPGH